MSPPAEVSLPIDPAFNVPAPRGAFTLFDCSSTGFCTDYAPDGIEDGRLVYRGSRGAASCLEGCAFAQTGSSTPTLIYVVLCLLFAVIAAVGLGIILYLARRQDEILGVLR